MNFRSQLAVWLSGVAILALLTGLAGCGGKGGFKVAPVKGKVTHQGQPVKGGSLTFTPIASGDTKAGQLGQPAQTQVSDDGTFAISPGAVVGKHRITYMPIFVAPKDYDDKPPPPPYVGLVPSPSEVEVKPGSNDISLELVAPQGAAAGGKPAPGAGLIVPPKL
jgi:hypothetical protein